MQVINLRNNETLKPKATIVFSEDDAKRIRKLLKKQPTRQIMIELPEVTAMLEKVDELLIETMGREKWEAELKKNREGAHNAKNNQV